MPHFFQNFHVVQSGTLTAVGLFYTKNYDIMRKFYLAAICALLCGAGASAQSLYTQPGVKPYWGIRAGLDISCPSDTYYYNVGAGGFVGGVFNVPVVSNFFIEPGITLYYDTWSPDSGGPVNDYEGDSYRQFGMRVPLMLGYHYPINQYVDLSIFSGPMLDVGFSSEYHDDTLATNTSMYKDREGFNRVNCSWNVGLGVSVYDVYFSVTGAFGMTNMNKRSPYSNWNMNTVSIAVGYNF